MSSVINAAAWLCVVHPLPETVELVFYLPVRQVQEDTQLVLRWPVGAEMSFHTQSSKGGFCLRRTKITTMKSVPAERRAEGKGILLKGRKKESLALFPLMFTAPSDVL